MPSGLTYKIHDGTDMSLRDFALTCVRQLGAGYRVTDGGEKEMPRDKAPVLEVSDYHIKQREAAEKELEHWLEVKNNPEECRRLYLKAHEKRADDNAEIEKDKLEIKARYQKMIGKVESWDVPSRYDSLKDLMLRQLNQSIEWDCKPYSPSPAEEKVETVDEWIDGLIEHTKWSIDYHKEQYAKEQESIAETNAYIKGLYDAIDKFEKENKYE